MFRTVALSIIRNFFTVQDQDGNTSVLILLAVKLSANLCDVYHCCVYSEKLLTMDRRTVRNI